MINKRMKGRRMNPDSAPGLPPYGNRYMENALRAGHSLWPALKNYSVNKERKVSSETAGIS